MTQDHPQRRLAAVLHADVAGYSRLTGEDELGTHAIVSERLEAFAAAVARRGGQVGNFAGDAILAQFPSVIQALACAVEIQRDFAGRNQGVPEDRQIRFRVGINLGEVIVDHGEPFGDGVNVAARLEALADPGGICISGATHDALGNSLPVEYESLGEQQVKNIAQPVRAYRVIDRPDTELPESHVAAGSSAAAPLSQRRRMTLLTALFAGLCAVGASLYWSFLRAPEVEPARAERMAFPLPDKPALAVLPFENLSADPEQAYFADGIVDDLITDLSQIESLFVAARQAAFAYRGKSIDLRQAGRELGVRYVLQGSIRKAGDRIRINAQLADAETGGHLWAQRYDRQMADIFDLQDEVTARIVAALSLELTKQERERLAHRYTNSAEAYDAFLQGQEYYFRLTEQDNARARALYRKAIETDPAFGRAYGALAVTYGRTVLYGWSNESDEPLEQALHLARRAVALDDRLPQVHWAHGFSLLMVKLYDQAIAAAERALAIDPDYPDAYGLLAWIHTYAGRPRQGLAFIDRALRLTPDPGGLLLSVKGEAEYWSGRLEEAAASFEETVARNPNVIDSRLHLAATYVRLGRQDDAEWEVQEILTLNPNLTLEDWSTRSLVQDPNRLMRLLDDLRQAGFK